MTLFLNDKIFMQTLHKFLTHKNFSLQLVLAEATDYKIQTRQETLYVGIVKLLKCILGRFLHSLTDNNSTISTGCKAVV